MDLALEFTYDVELGQPQMPGPGPYGNRIVAPVTGGSVTGDRIHGSVLGPGADWLLIGPDGWGRLDVRGQIQTDDGACVYVTYTGLLQITDKVMGAMLSAEEETGFEDQYYRITPRLESGDERYAWVNQTIFVGRGRFTRSGVAYEVFRVT